MATPDWRRDWRRHGDEGRHNPERDRHDAPEERPSAATRPARLHITSTSVAEEPPEAVACLRCWGSADSVHDKADLWLVRCAHCEDQTLVRRPAYLRRAPDPATAALEVGKEFRRLLVVVGPLGHSVLAVLLRMIRDALAVRVPNSDEPAAIADFLPAVRRVAEDVRQLQSRPELYLWRALREAGLADGFVLQGRIPVRYVGAGGTWHDGVATPDFVHTRRRVCVFVDGWAYHYVRPAQVRRDHERDNALRAAGWAVLRVLGADVLHDPARVIAEVERALDAEPVRQARPAA